MPVPLLPFETSSLVTMVISNVVVVLLDEAVFPSLGREQMACFGNNGADNAAMGIEVALVVDDPVDMMNKNQNRIYDLNRHRAGLERKKVMERREWKY